MILFSFFDNFGMKEYNYMFRVVFVGDVAVGKTQIINKFVKNNFSDNSYPTNGVNYATKVVEVEDKTIKLQLWDTSGQERYESITRSYLKGSHLTVLVYAIDDKNSFNNISKWVEEVKIQNKDIKFLLVGNKWDLGEEKRVVTKDEAGKYAEENGMEFVEVSAKTGDGIDDMFKSSLSKLLKDVKNEENNNLTYYYNNYNKLETLLFDNQDKDSIKIEKTSCWSKCCPCCPCLKKPENAFDYY